jgi:hypothetical protein
MINILVLRVAGMWYKCRRRFEVSLSSVRQAILPLGLKNQISRHGVFEFLVVKRVGVGVGVCFKLFGQSVSVHVRLMFLEGGNDAMLRSR